MSDGFLGSAVYIKRMPLTALTIRSNPIKGNGQAARKSEDKLQVQRRRQKRRTPRRR